MGNVTFPKSTPISLIFVGHLISVMSRILDLTNSSGANCLETKNTFMITFTKLTLKFALSLFVLKNFAMFTLFPKLVHTS